MGELWKREVELTQSCLGSNPKSYGAWHHRAWCLAKMSDPDWARELQLTAKFLQMDERNFHCWDYRQQVAVKAGQQPEEELAFCLERINTNFSNYSAWHSRSKLLPLAHPQEGLLMQEKVHHTELDLVQNAAFTDPEDSSAWLYHSWLVGGRPQTKLTPLPLYLLVEGGEVSLSTSHPVKLSDLVISQELEWKADGGGRGSCLWTAQLPPQFVGSLTVQLVEQEEVLELVPETQQRSFVLGSGYRDLRFQPVPNTATKEVLEEELENCRQLLELEPDSKWTNHTKAMLMRALDSSLHFANILDTLDKLKIVDPLRKNYYEDLKSKIFLENALEASQDFDCLDLTAMKLSRVYHKHYLKLFKEVKYC